jgi:PA14 domain-containing protein
MKHLMRGAMSGLALLLTAGAVQEEVKAGLIGEYYSLEGEVQDFPTLAPEKKPVVRRLDKQINWDSTSEKFAGTDLEDHFYVRWTGLIRTPKDAKYTFYTESDDGSRLFIDGKQVVENSGLHPMEEKSGEIELKAGDHEIKVDLFENEGEVGVKLSWEAAGMTKEVVPDAALFHRKDKDLDK